MVGKERKRLRGKNRGMCSFSITPSETAGHVVGSFHLGVHGGGKIKRCRQSVGSSSLQLLLAKILHICLIGVLFEKAGL